MNPFFIVSIALLSIVYVLLAVCVIQLNLLRKSFANTQLAIDIAKDWKETAAKWQAIANRYREGYLKCKQEKSQM
jgi:hypothetical protein